MVFTSFLPPQQPGCAEWLSLSLKSELAAFFALLLPFRPIYAFSPLSGGPDQDLGNPKKLKRRAFCLRYARICLSRYPSNPSCGELQTKITSLFGFRPFTRFRDRMNRCNFFRRRRKIATAIAEKSCHMGDSVTASIQEPTHPNLHLLTGMTAVSTYSNCPIKT